MIEQGDFPPVPRPPEEDPRELAGRVVQGLYRLVKACQLHTESNQAVAQVVEYVQASIAAYHRVSGQESAAILFSKSAVFVNRRMLRTSREAYQLALDLGEALLAAGATEVSVHHAVEPAELMEFGRALADFTRLGQVPEKISAGGWPHLGTRRVLGMSRDGHLSPPQRAARTYAAALMILRGFHADLAAGKYELRQGIKRIAQRLVSQPGTTSRMLLSIAAAPPSESDRAGVALSSAIVAHAMAHQLTEDRTVLAGLVAAALLYDVGQPRLIGYAEPGADAPRVERSLSDLEERQLPASAVVALTALGKLHPPNLVRAAVVYEALSLRPGGAPAYGGRRPASLLARVVSVARNFVELRTRRGASQALAIDDALQVLESQATDGTGRALVKLLTGALGIFPAGTLVELSTGETGVVVATPALPVDFARPPIRIMYDAQAQLLETPIDVDLAYPKAGEPHRVIRRTIDANDQQMKQMRAYVAQLSAARSRRSADKIRAVRADQVAREEERLKMTDRPGRRASLEAVPAVAPAAPKAPPAPVVRSVSDLPPAPQSAKPRQQTRAFDPRIDDDDGFPEEAQVPTRISSPGESAVAHAHQLMREGRSRTGVGGLTAPGAGPAVRDLAAFDDQHRTETPVSRPHVGRPTETPVSRPHVGRSTATPAAAPIASETDALLAAYLTDELGSSGGEEVAPVSSSPPASPSSHGGSAEPRSWGARWTGNGRGSTNTGASDSPSSQGRSAGLRWSPPSSSTGSNSPMWPSRETGTSPGLWPNRQTGAARDPMASLTGEEGTGFGGSARTTSSSPAGPASSGPRSTGGLRFGGPARSTGVEPPASDDDALDAMFSPSPPAVAAAPPPQQEAPAPLRRPSLSRPTATAPSAATPPEPSSTGTPPPSSTAAPTSGAARFRKADTLAWGNPRRGDKK